MHMSPHDIKAEMTLAGIMDQRVIDVPQVLLTSSKDDIKPIKSRFVFVKGIETDRQTDKTCHHEIRSHAMSMVRQKQRATDCARHIKSQNLALHSRPMITPSSVTNDRLNRGVILSDILTLSREHWVTAEQHFDLVLPPVWEHGSLRRITQAAQSDGPSTFSTLYSQTVEERKQICLKDPLHACAHLALSTSCTTWVMKSNLDPTLPAIFMKSALAALRNRCSSSSYMNEDIVCSIVCLCTAETWRGDLVAAVTHMRMVCHMLVELGGVKSFRPLLLDLALLADKHIALHLFQPPMLSLHFDPGPTIWPSLAKGKRHSIGIESPFSTLSSALLSADMRTLLGLELNKIISHLRDCILVAIDVQSLSGVGLMEATYARWFFLRTSAILYRLLSLPQDVTSPRTRARRHVQIALIVWINLVASDNVFQVRTRWISRLEESMQQCLLDTGQSDTLNAKVLLWTTTLGAFISSDQPEAKRTFISITKILTKQLCLCTKASLREVLECSFFLGDLQDGALDELFIWSHNLIDR